MTDDPPPDDVTNTAPPSASDASGHITGYAAVVWHPGNPPEVEILDQTRLPHEVRAVRTSRSAVVADAIRHMQVRGAPAIGIAAAFGVALAAHEYDSTSGGGAGGAYVSSLRLRTRPNDGGGTIWEHLEEACSSLAATRPTAVNLFWAIDRMRRRIAALREAGSDATSEAGHLAAVVRRALDAEAVSILEEDVAACFAIGTHGRPLIEDGDSVLTHCNAGALATGGWGTALAPIFLAHRAGVRLHVFVDETRPFLQGARLTAWELQAAGIDCTLITDSMAAHFMGIGRVSKVIVGADRIAANGDVANKIGTYGLAIIAQAHGIPFYVAAPTSTIDPALASGAAIPIEYRDPGEVTSFRGLPVAPHGMNASHPAFDVTPARLVTSIITEVGIHQPPYGPALASATRPPGAVGT